MVHLQLLAFHLQHLSSQGAGYLSQILSAQAAGYSLQILSSQAAG